MPKTPRLSGPWVCRIMSIHARNTRLGGWGLILSEQEQAKIAAMVSIYERLLEYDVTLSEAGVSVTPQHFRPQGFPPRATDIGV